jgi:hypothetical protein
MLTKRQKKLLSPKARVKGRYFHSGKYYERTIKTANPKIFKAKIEIIFQLLLSQKTKIQGKTDTPATKLSVFTKSSETVII